MTPHTGSSLRSKTLQRRPNGYSSLSTHSSTSSTFTPCVLMVLSSKPESGTVSHFQNVISPVVFYTFHSTLHKMRQLHSFGDPTKTSLIAGARIAPESIWQGSRATESQFKFFAYGTFMLTSLQLVLGLWTGDRSALLLSATSGIVFT